jgi:hypothetical protein
VLPELPITYIHDAQPWRLRVFYDDTRPFESLRAPTVSYFAIMAMADVTATPLDLKNFRAPSRAW